MIEELKLIEEIKPEIMIYRVGSEILVKSQGQIDHSACNHITITCDYYIGLLKQVEELFQLVPKNVRFDYTRMLYGSTRGRIMTLDRLKS